MEICSGRGSYVGYMRLTNPPGAYAASISSRDGMRSPGSSSASMRSGSFNDLSTRARASESEKIPPGFSEARYEKIGRYDQGTSGCISARRFMRPAGRSLSATSRMRHTPHRASTSSFARCETLAQTNTSAINDSLWDAKRGSAIRDSARESIQMSLTFTPPFTDSMKERSNVAL